MTNKLPIPKEMVDAGYEVLITRHNVSSKTLVREIIDAAFNTNIRPGVDMLEPVGPHTIKPGVGMVDAPTKDLDILITFAKEVVAEYGTAHAKYDTQGWVDWPSNPFTPTQMLKIERVLK